MKLRILLLINCLTVYYAIVSANGNAISTIPFSTHFPKSTYDAGYENWDIIQDESGVVYFANNNGLLQFNNKSWRCYPLPNRTIVRSLAIDSTGKIYAGGQNEFGYFIPNESGDLKYYSLKESIPEKHREFEDVWDILLHPEYGIFFMTKKKLYHSSGEEVSVYETRDNYNFIGLYGQDIIIQDNLYGLKIFSNGSMKEMEQVVPFNFGSIIGIINLKNGQYLISTLHNGIYITDGNSYREWLTDKSQFVNNNGIYSSAVFNDGRIAVGTTQSGLYILDENGNISQHINESNGLIDNKVLSLLIDRDQNLWLGLENGIDYLHTNSPFTRLATDKKMKGAGYDMAIFDERIYFGTSKKVYYTSSSKNSTSKKYITEISELENIKGQVWGFSAIDNKLLMGHHDGGFYIDNLKIEKISPNWGVWLFQKLESNPDFLIAGTYMGISIYRNTNNLLEFEYDLAGFEESSRFVEQDELGNIWVSQPYQGIYKLSLNDAHDSVSVNKYGISKGLPSDLANYLFKISGEIIFTSEEGIYSYNAVMDSFEINTTYEDIFGNQESVLRLVESSSGNIWYITKDDLGVLEVKEKSISKEINRISYKGVRDLLVNGFEMIYPYNDSNIFLGSESGFIHLNPKKYSDFYHKTNVVFDEIVLTSGKNEIVFNGNNQFQKITSNKVLNGHIPEIPVKLNSVYFSFISTEYNNPHSKEYRYYLKGLEKDWSEWVKKTEREYSYLRPGDYTFHVQSKNLSGKLSPVLTYRFIILPPWYFSKAAKLVYVIMITGMLIWLVLFLRKKFLIQKEKVIVTEKKVEQLKEERLQDELNYKSRELISASLHIGHKNSMLLKIEREINKIVENANDTEFSMQLRNLIKIIHSEEGTDKEIRQFKKLFNELHPGFMDRISSAYPNLSSKDLKMCSYMRMNMSTKEIASIANMTIRGVEGSRYRLRKKLQLSTDTDLATFILHY